MNLPDYLSLAVKKVLIAGIANDSSIAYGCAKAMREVGADLAVTYLNEGAKRPGPDFARASQNIGYVSCRAA